MEKYEEFLKLAQKEIAVSDHLLYKTFSLIKDTKFLIAITEHIIKASEYSLLTILEYERHSKRIGPFPSNFGIQIEIYEENISKRHKLDPKYARLFKNLMELEIYINDSPIRFKRGEKYILSTTNYEMKTLDLEKVKRLIEEGADINANKGGETPLFAAVGAGSNEVAKFLIAKGADVNAPGFGGLTPLFPACVICDKDVVELLITKGADVNAKTQGEFTGLTPLHTACRGGQKEVVELLISKGADLNAKITSAPAVLSQTLGATPLHHSSSLGHKDVVELLIAKGADINARKNNNQTPMHEACSTGHIHLY